MTYFPDDLGYSPDPDHPDPRDLIDQAVNAVESERDDARNLSPQEGSCTRDVTEREGVACKRCGGSTRVVSGHRARRGFTSTIDVTPCPTCHGTGRR